MADKKLEELKMQLHSLNQNTPEEIKKEIMEEKPEIKPVQVAEPTQVVPPQPIEEVKDPIEQLSNVVNQLTPEQMAMFQKMISPQAPEVEKAPVVEKKPEVIPEPVQEKPREPTQEEINEQVARMQEEINRLQNNGVFRAELIFQLLTINSHLDRIAKGFESE